MAVMRDALARTALPKLLRGIPVRDGLTIRQAAAVMDARMNRSGCSWRLGVITASVLVLLAPPTVAQNPGQWTMTGRTPDLQRFSPLSQINKTNVKNLVAAWT